MKKLLKNPIVKYCLIYTLIIIFIIVIFRLIKFISSFFIPEKTENVYVLLVVSLQPPSRRIGSAFPWQIRKCVLV